MRKFIERFETIMLQYFSSPIDLHKKRQQQVVRCCGKPDPIRPNPILRAEGVMGWVRALGDAILVDEDEELEEGFGGGGELPGRQVRQQRSERVGRRAAAPGGEMVAI